MLGFTCDWLHPPLPAQGDRPRAARHAQARQLLEVESHYGHDAFLLEREKMQGIMGAFLASGARTYSRD